MNPTPIAALAVLLALIPTPILADGDERAERAEKRVAPLSDAVARSECGACHMPYPAALLPERSWRAILADLGRHFDEDASLDEPTRGRILAVLTAGAGDRVGFKLLRGLDPAATPRRISDLPRWRKEHRKVSGLFTRPGINSASNCPACHTAGAAGDFGKATRQVPR